MNAFADQLRTDLSGRVVLFGIGNRMKGDDGVGSFVVERLANRLDATCVDGGVAPENHLEKVAAEQPDTILLIDAVDFDGTPGEIRILQPSDLTKLAVSTHAMSLNMVADYLMARGCGCVLLAAIQPSGMKLGQELSPHTKAAADRLESILRELLGKGENRGNA